MWWEIKWFAISDPFAQSQQRYMLAKQFCQQWQRWNCHLNCVTKEKVFYRTCSYIILFLCFRKEHQCDEKSNGPQFLTDLHNPNNVTCWRSDFVNSDSAENVTLTVSLKKKYELTYVSLHFCHAKPHSMAIYKR